MGRPRLLLLITLAETGGAQSYVASLLPALVDEFDVAVAAHGEGFLREAVPAAGARFLPLDHVRRPLDPVQDLLGLIELVRLFRRERPLIVHANSSKAGVLGRVAAFAARVPVRIFTAHGWAFAAHSGVAATAYLWADRLMRPLTTTTICVGDGELASGLRARTCRADRTVVIHNGVDLDRPRRRPAADGAAGAEDAPGADGADRVAGADPAPGADVADRAPWAGAADAPDAGDGAPVTLISVGRLRGPKDFTTLVRAVAALDAGSVLLRIVGEGPDRAALAAEVRRLRLDAVVELAGERTDVPELLAGADVFVLSSDSEGFPISVLEAMAAGLPVVASAVGGVGELVRDGETGALVPPRDPEALAGAIRALVADPRLRARLGDAARLRAEREFSVAAFRRAHLELYRRAVRA